MLGSAIAVLLGLTLQSVPSGGKQNFKPVIPSFLPVLSPASICSQIPWEPAAELRSGALL